MSAPQTWVYILNNSLIAIADVPANYVIGTIIPGQGEIDGYMTKDVSGAFGGPSDGNVFVGDGRAWLHPGRRADLSHPARLLAQRATVVNLRRLTL